MMKRLSLLGVGVLFALAVPPALTAQSFETRPDSRAEARAEARAQFLEARKERLAQRQVLRKAAGFRRLQVDGEQVRPATEKLAKELKWHDSLRSAQRAAKATGKPIVWIHALGDLTGVL
jgi:hypothetical protein